MWEPLYTCGIIFYNYNVWLPLSYNLVFRCHSRDRPLLLANALLVQKNSIMHVGVWIRFHVRIIVVHRLIVPGADWQANF